MTTNYTRFGKNNPDGQPGPASPCPSCFSPGTVVDTHQGLTFLCSVCGCYWTRSEKAALEHAKFLKKLSIGQVGDQ